MILTCSARNESTDLLQIAEHDCKEGRKRSFQKGLFVCIPVGSDGNIDQHRRMLSRGWARRMIPV
jgi:hypothetical protein